MNIFKYLKEKGSKVIEFIRSQEDDSPTLQVINVTFTGLLIGLAIWLWRTNISFLQGLSIAIFVKITLEIIGTIKITQTKSKEK